MNTIKVWITRELKEDNSENEYLLHFTEPELKCWDGEEENMNVPYWHSASETSYTINPDNSYGLNYGECMQWVMVKKADFEGMEAKVRELESIQTIKKSTKHIHIISA